MLHVLDVRDAYSQSIYLKCQKRRTASPRTPTTEFTWSTKGSILAAPYRVMVMLYYRGEKSWTFDFNIMVPGPPFLSFVAYFSVVNIVAKLGVEVQVFNCVFFLQDKSISTKILRLVRSLVLSLTATMTSSASSSFHGKGELREILKGSYSCIHVDASTAKNL